jgi:uncharacterized protein
MAMHIVDRRLNPGGKSLENRQRFLRRAKAHLRRAVRDAANVRNIREIDAGGEIAIPSDGAAEPNLSHGPGGVRDAVLPGNRDYLAGDILPRPSGNGGNGGLEGGSEGDAEDTFRFVLTREEFLDLFFDDLELPDLAKRRLSKTEHDSPTRAGYAVSGPPSNLAVARTMRLAMARRMALRRPKADEIERLEAQAASSEDEESRTALAANLEALRARARRIPYIDPIDLRFRRYESHPKPVAKAVMFCLMDVSASMSEHMKDLAKRFYMLLYLFLGRRYRHVDIVFIRHTEEAKEVDEETFFHGRETGGTVVSSALAQMHRILADRYPSQDWNIYAAQASDGDNSYGDGPETRRLLQEAILPVTQYFAYLEVAETEAGGREPARDTALWTTYEHLRTEWGNLVASRVSERRDIFPVFRDLFRRETSGRIAAYGH